MKKLVFLSLLSVALLTSCGNGAQKDALKAQNDSFDGGTVKQKC